MSDGFDSAGLARLDATMHRHVAAGSAAGLVWAVARDNDVHVGWGGTSEDGGAGAPIARDAIFRISSMTKPITAIAVLTLVEDCVLRLDDPVDAFLPELADRRVLRDPAGALDDTEPAIRPISVRDVLTFRLGLGMDMEHWDRPQPVLERMAELGLGAGPPAPQEAPPADEWMELIGQLPLSYQPGERWLYHVGADVAGVLVERAAGAPFIDVLRERIFEPLGMVDTDFHVPAAKLARFGPVGTADPATGALGVYDPAEGQWSTPPAFAGGGAGLVSTVDDYLAFARMLLAGGVGNGQRILSPATVAAMVTAHVERGPDPDGALGWGLGLAVHGRQTGIALAPGSYGWDGGLGTSWANDPVNRLIGVLLTNRAWSSPTPPPVMQDFWTSAATAMR